MMLAAGYRNGIAAAASGMTWPGGWTEVCRFGAAAANHNGSQRTIPVPVEMEKEPYGNGGECYRGNEKIIIFYNMKCKDVLDEKLRVVDENEITWHESRWNVRLLSDRAILFMIIDCQYEKDDWSSWWVLTAGWHEDMLTWIADDHVWLESEITWHEKRSRRYELGWHRTEVSAKEANAIG